MAHYKLTYFNGRGRAEIIRLIFAAADEKYEDVRIDRDKWPALKASINPPFGQVPILEIDGKTFCQSYAIGRYLARKFKLAGKSDLEQLQADMIIDCLEDALKPFISAMYESDETRKAEMKKKYLEEQLPASYASLESILKSNKGGDGFLVGDEMDGHGTLLEKYPKLKALLKRVESVPKVAAWLAKRPVTEF